MIIIKINVLVKFEHHQYILPVLFDEKFNVVRPVLEYSTYLFNIGRSESTIKNAVKACQMLLEYMGATQSSFQNLNELFESFVQVLFAGTIDENLEDSTNLYWLPNSRNSANIYLNSLNCFGDWLVENYQTENLNPLKTKSFNYDVRRVAALFHKNKNSFLGHLKNPHIDINKLAARSILGKPNIISITRNTIEFPEKLIQEFLYKGVGGAKDCNVRLRDMLIILLLHGGGIRESEALHLWIHDVELIQEEIKIDGKLKDVEVAKIKIYHPEEGKAPLNWKSIKGFTTRKHFLLEVYGLKPRNTLHGKDRVGFKTTQFENKQNYLQVYFFPWHYGKLFAELWKVYSLIRASIEDNHPYAFINFDKYSYGEPYRLSTFNKNYQKALKRIGLNKNYEEGLSPHAHRHSYGKRLRRCNIEQEIIRRTMHHSSLTSQEVYTELSNSEITNLIRLVDIDGE